MKNLDYLLFFLFLLLAESTFAIDLSGSITSGGKNRTFIFHAPGSSVPENLPVLLVFHGDGGTGAGIRNSTGFNTIADANNFMAIYPNADTDGSGWHRAIDQPKDVQFVSDLIDYFCSTYHIDGARVYATGHSAGGFMTYNLAVNLPGKVAAFAPVSANMYANNGNYSYFSSAAFRPVPILHLHGDPDGTVAYPDPDHQPTPWSEWPLTQFAYYTCGNTTYTLPNLSIATNVTKLRFCTGAPPTGVEVSLIRVVGTGHGWPSTSGFNASQTIWDFVKNYSISGAPSCRNPLPVALTSFQAETENGIVHLIWRTTAEKHFSHFEIQRSRDAKTFQSISNVNAVSETGGNYEYWDAEVQSGIYYYRLKMVDEDGSNAFSALKPVELRLGITSSIFPSPANNFFEISSQTKSFPMEVKILNLKGQVVAIEKWKQAGGKINVAQLPEALYIVTANDRVVGKLLIRR